MGAVAKNPIPELAPVMAPDVNEAAEPVRVIGLEEARSMSKFVPVVVLLPASYNDTDDSLRRAVKDPVAAVSTASTIFELFGKTARPRAFQSSETDLVFGDARVNFSSMEASRNGEPVKLTAMEFKALKYLAQNARRVISRAELLNEVWGYENYPTTRTVDNHILRLRRKLERDQSRPVHFRTVHGAGYKFLP
jgi:DNA-binding response OmpR family regulator